MFKERSTEKLIEYIQTLPDKEQKAIVKTLSSPKSKKMVKVRKPKTEHLEWWKDKAFTDELDKEFAAYKSGKVKAFSLEEVKASIATLRERRKAK